MKSLKVSLVAGLVLLGNFTGCTEPGETTGVAAATGGVIGAGLGAIVGNQTGDPGSGLVIGAAAGAAGGALVGNALEAQEQSIRSQDEAIERQEQTIAAQRAEIEELRRMNPDYQGPKARLRRELGVAPLNPPKLNPPMQRPAPSNSYSYSEQLYGGKNKPGATASSKGAAAIQEKSLTAPTTSIESVPAKINQDADAAIPAVTTAGKTNECQQAALESDKARSASEAADRLFHYRRAIRLCPADADYHAALGQVYLSLNRKEDAQFEFKEALSLDPSNAIAKRSVESVKIPNDDNRF